MCRVTILYLTDSTSLHSELEQYLPKETVEIKRCPKNPELLGEYTRQQPDLVLLDCLEQAIQELVLCREIRKLYSGPLILLANKDNAEGSILALKLGADVSLSVSDGVPLVAANIKALLRRWAPSSPPSMLSFGSLTIDARRRDAFLSGESLNLSTIEFEVLWVVAQKSGVVVSRDEIHHELYSASYNGYDRNIDLYVSRIRRKIGDDPGSPIYLKTVRGIGYQFISAKDPLLVGSM
jgi:DNA-binding response OmpR family regulator